MSRSPSLSISPNAAASPLFLKNVAGQHSHEMASLIFQEQRWLKIFHVGGGMFDRVHYMPPCNEEVLPAIIVVIEQVRTPTGKSESQAFQAWAGESRLKYAGAKSSQRYLKF